MPTLILARSLARALSEALHPLTGSAADFDPLMDFIGDAQFVLLGEASHGTHEFYRTRAEVIQRLVIASTDPLAADVVGAQLLGFGPQAVRHLWEAARLGIGEADTEKMQFPAMGLREAIEAFTEAAYGKRLTFQHA
jgi:hypothetical protein